MSTSHSNPTSTSDRIVYWQVDVFSDQPLSGNSLTIFPGAERFSTTVMKQLTHEMRQFESIFLQKIDDRTYRARIFTLQEELDFAGHPSLGAAASLHDSLLPDKPETSWTLVLNKKQVTIESAKTSYGYRATMDQGPADFGNVISASGTITFLQELNLTETDWDSRYPLQVVSTGLPYLLIPLKDGRSNKAKIVTSTLSAKLKAIGADFVGVFEVSGRSIRTWDNLGMVEDIATGSLAGPVGAYLVNYGVAKANEIIILKQGTNLGRPSELSVVVKKQSNSPTEHVFVTGSVVKIAAGVFDVQASQKILQRK